MTFTDEELNQMTLTNEFGARVYVPSLLTNFAVSKPAAHWSDDFPPTPASFDLTPPPAPRSFTAMEVLERQRESTRTLDAMMSMYRDSITAGIGWVTIGADFAKREDMFGIWKAPATQAAAYAGACDSDMPGIAAWQAEPKEPPPEPPKAPSRVKPALAGLGVTTPEDHRLGGWKACR